MALEGEFLAEVEQFTAELTAAGRGVIVDAATGAGETTLQLARAMRGGRLITVDCDASSWTDWALPALQKAGLEGQVEFMQADIGHLPLQDDSVDLVVSDATLSAMGVWAVDAIREFYRVLRPGGRLVLRDLLSEDESDSNEDNIAVRSWRLAKAAAHLAGEGHYEELPTAWVQARLREAGFRVLSFRIGPHRRLAGSVSYEEWRRLDPAGGIQDEPLREAFRHAHRHLVLRAEAEGLTTKAGQYACWAEKPA